MTFKQISEKQVQQFNEESNHPRYTPLKKVEDTAIKAVGRAELAS